MIKKIKSFFGVLAAVLASVIVLAVFMASGPLSEALALLPFMKVDPLLTGGEVVSTYPLETTEGALEVRIHEGIFRAFIGTPSKGYKQVDFVPMEGMDLPTVIKAPLDLDEDGIQEATVSIDTTTGKSGLEGKDRGACYSLQASARVKEKWVIRVSMKRTKDTEGSCASCASQGTCPLARLLMGKVPGTSSLL